MYRAVFGIFLAALFAGCTQQSTLRYDVTGQVKNGKLKLLDGQTIGIPAKDKQKVIFEDLFPGANWGHPAQLLIETANGETIWNQPVDIPPVVLPTPETNRFALASLTQSVPKATFQLVPNKKRRVKEPKHFYALLINGQANSFQGEQRQWNDFAFLYRTLVEIYGYLPENIYVANSTHQKGDNDLNGDGQPDIRFGSSREAIEAIFEELKTKLTTDHHLLIGVNDHALRRDEKTLLLLEGGHVSAKEFSQWVMALPTEKVVHIFQQCFGGAFVRPVAEGNRVAMSASTDREFSWATPDKLFNEFFYWVIAAFAGQHSNGKPVLSDANQDGRVTVQEAFSFALLHERREESPLLESAPYLGTAKQVGLGD